MTDCNRCADCGKALPGGEYICTPCRHLRAAYERGKADGRADERAAIVAWLRKPDWTHAETYAAAVEAGEHIAKADEAKNG